VVLPGILHHIIQRGTRQEDIFLNDEGRGIFLDLVAEAAEQYGVWFWA
jgi:hypothetical protein